MKTHTLFALYSIGLTFIIQSNPNENIQQKLLKERLERIEQKINGFINTSAEEVAQKIAHNNFISLELLSFLETNEDIAAIKQESLEVCDNLRYRIVKQIESTRLELSQECDRKSIRNYMLWGSHLSASTSMIYAGIQVGIIDPSHAKNCAVSSLVGIGLSYGVWQLGNTSYFNYYPDKSKANELHQMQKIVDDKIRYRPKTK